MSDVHAEPKPLIPALKPFYEWAAPLAWPIIRIAVGWNLIIHAWVKLGLGMEKVLPGFAQMGFEPAWFFAWGALLIELAGGIAIILGLFTRFFAAAVAIEMLVIFGAYWAQRFFLARPRLRIRAAVGPRHLCDRVARRRPLLARPQIGIEL
jgi:putative oxidoreductase